MAMTKAERAVVQALEEQAALRWPTFEEPKPTVEPKGYRDDSARGWLFNAHIGEVQQAWSGTTAHGSFYNGKRSGGTQGGRWLYVTEGEAHRALRWAVCRQIAARLHALDARASLLTDEQGRGK